MSALYELEEVGRSFRQGEQTIEAVDTVTATIAPGELVAITGASGSGKTTLLQLLGGLERPTRGRIRFEDADLSDLSDEQLTTLRSRAFGFVFQQFNLIPTLSSRENIEAALAPVRSDRADRRRHAGELLERVGLGDRADHLPGQLSGGQQQRVAIARALANGPRVILADEPTGNLDARTSEEIAGLLTGLAGDGTAVVLVTHDARLAERAPRVVELRDGRIVGERAGDGRPGTAIDADGRLTLPQDLRDRWSGRRVGVEDHGSHLVVRADT
ncbi:MAG: ABC transporter ATP-binding protein [Solirubrobacterales bacterium]